MTYSTSFTDSTTDHDAARRALLPVGVGTFAGSAVWTGLGAHSLREVAVVLAVAAVVTAAVYGLLLPRSLRRESAGGTALTLALLAALLTLPAFWSGLPLILGAAGVLLGLAGRNAATGAGKSVTAIGVGALAVLGYLTIYIVDGLLMGNM